MTAVAGCQLFSRDEERRLAEAPQRLLLPEELIGMLDRFSAECLGEAGTVLARDAARAIDIAYDCLGDRLDSTPGIAATLNLAAVHRFNEQQRIGLKQLATGEITDREYDLRLQVSKAILAAALRLDDGLQDDRIVL